MVSHRKASYEARGREFDTKAEAESWEKLCDALSEFDHARKVWMKAAAQFAKTADGHAFEFDRWDDYWYIDENYLGQPGLLNVKFRYDTEIRIDGDEIVVELYTDNRGRTKYDEHKISDLYWDKTNAQIKFAEVLKAHMAETQEFLIKTNAEIERAKAAN